MPVPQPCDVVGDAGDTGFDAAMCAVDIADSACGSPRRPMRCAAPAPPRPLARTRLSAATCGSLRLRVRFGISCCFFRCVSLRSRIWTLPGKSRVRAVATGASKPVANRRLRPSHASVRSTARRRGNASNPRPDDARFTASSRQRPLPSKAAASCGPASAPAAKMRSNRGNRCRNDRHEEWRSPPRAAPRDARARAVCGAACQGSIRSHSASPGSLARRRPGRADRARAISARMWRLTGFVHATGESQPTEIAQLIPKPTPAPRPTPV